MVFRKHEPSISPPLLIVCLNVLPLCLFFLSKPPGRKNRLADLFKHKKTSWPVRARRFLWVQAFYSLLLRGRLRRKVGMSN